MNLEGGPVGTHVAASDLHPSAKIHAGRTEPPGEVHVPRSGGGEVEGLRPLTRRAIRPSDSVSRRIGSIGIPPSTRGCDKIRIRLRENVSSSASSDRGSGNFARHSIKSPDHGRRQPGGLVCRSNWRGGTVNCAEVLRLLGSRPDRRTVAGMVRYGIVAKNVNGAGPRSRCSAG